MAGVEEMLIGAGIGALLGLAIIGIMSVWRPYPRISTERSRALVPAPVRPPPSATSWAVFRCECCGGFTDVWGRRIK